MSNMIRQTPWGTPQTENMIQPGIVFVSTPSHGGLWLSPLRQQQLRAKLPEFKPFTGSLEWLEEDCDAAVAPLVWPEYYSDAAVRAAVNMALTCSFANGTLLKAYVSRQPDLIQRKLRWEDQHRNHWELGGGGTQLGGWVFSVYRIRDHAHIERFFQDYPEHRLFTDYELERISLSVGEATKRYEASQKRPQRRVQPAYEYDTDAAGMCYSDADPGL